MRGGERTPGRMRQARVETRRASCRSLIPLTSFALPLISPDAALCISTDMPGTYTDTSLYIPKPGVNA